MKEARVMSGAVSARNLTIRHDYSWKEWLSLILHLGKAKISLFATLSTATGYLLASGSVTIHILVPTVAVWLLACGACALNQYQDRAIDQLMERTKSRPIPSGRLNPETALSISFGLTLLGSLILLCGKDHLATGLGVFAVFWYILIYTPLKQRTAFATIPGALVGAIPPLLGWVSGGGSMLDPRIWGVALFFFMWQVPHFWLLLLDHAGDYEKAGLPSIVRIFSSDQMRRILFVWLLSTGVCGFSIPLFGFIRLPLVRYLLLVATLWFFWNAAHFFIHSQRVALRSLFTKVNIYAFLVLFLLSFERLPSLTLRH